MALFKKKKKYEIDIDSIKKDSDLHDETGLGNLNLENEKEEQNEMFGKAYFGQSNPVQRETFEHQSQPFSPYDESLKREYEIISSKIDTLKAMLESISQRLSNIERELYEKEKRNKLW